jgi:predicted small metal-binding protein
MMKTFACKDVGLNCAFTASADTALMLMPKIYQHMKEAHNVKEETPSLTMKFKSAIKG